MVEFPAGYDERVAMNEIGRNVEKVMSRIFHNDK